MKEILIVSGPTTIPKETLETCEKAVAELTQPPGKHLNYLEGLLLARLRSVIRLIKREEKKL